MGHFCTLLRQMFSDGQRLDPEDISYILKSRQNSTWTECISEWGVVAVSIDLLKVDINQCDNNGGMFAGSHKCKVSSTKCVHRPGHGFQRGSYDCVCKDKFHFPDPSAKTKRFNGSDVERAYLLWRNNYSAPPGGSLANFTDYDRGYECVACKRGCDTCEDDAPCFVEYNALLRGVALGIQTFCMTIALFLGIVVFRVRKNRSLYSSIWLILEVMLFGALLLYATEISSRQTLDASGSVVQRGSYMSLVSIQPQLVGDGNVAYQSHCQDNNISVNCADEDLLVAIVSSVGNVMSCHDVELRGCKGCTGFSIWMMTAPSSTMQLVGVVKLQLTHFVCMTEGVYSSRWRDLLVSSWNGSMSMATSGFAIIHYRRALELSPVTKGLQCCHFDIKTAEEDDKLFYSILLWPLPLDFLCQSKQRLVACDHWSLARIEMFHYNLDHIHGVLNHSHGVGALQEEWGQCGGTDVPTGWHVLLACVVVINIVYRGSRKDFASHLDRADYLFLDSELFQTVHRVLAEFQSRKARRVHVRDRDVFKYLAGIVLVVIGFMSAYGTVNMDHIRDGINLIDIGQTVEETKFHICRLNWWDYVIEIAEFLFLCMGIYMSYCIRSAPSDFHETRWLSLAVYIEALVSGTLHVLRHFLWLVVNPDYIYLMYFVRCQLTVTLMIILIFGPKIWYAHKKDEDEYSGNRGRAFSSADISDHMTPETMKLQDGFAGNGDVDIGEVNIADMDPEDIKAELKRVYTQLQILKTKTMRKDNPHISKRRGGRKNTHRRFSLQAFHHHHRHRQHQRSEQQQAEASEAEHENLPKTPEESTASVENVAIPLEERRSDAGISPSMSFRPQRERLGHGGSTRSAADRYDKI
ncbi:PREDICTED: probable G-protein coupled receptor 158 [Priapulus caudatus]|uniref:Probable G-protein coupled receptor 158 n=1 Tax=Priapulus caudatus TaxID=37621 RepID=A0ABM1EXG9_PRICU|nr:PREDICTED: probable G-protein coupled receptor 158 [Priapulus caudatus]